MVVVISGEENGVERGGEAKGMAVANVSCEIVDTKERSDSRDVLRVKRGGIVRWPATEGLRLSFSLRVLRRDWGQHCVALPDTEPIRPSERRIGQRRPDVVDWTGPPVVSPALVGRSWCGVVRLTPILILIAKSNDAEEPKGCERYSCRHRALCRWGQAQGYADGREGRRWCDQNSGATALCATSSGARYEECVLVLYVFGAMREWTATS